MNHTPSGTRIEIHANDTAPGEAVRAKRRAELERCAVKMEFYADDRPVTVPLWWERLNAAAGITQGDVVVAALRAADIPVDVLDAPRGSLHLLAHAAYPRVVAVVAPIGLACALFDMAATRGP